MTRIQFDSFGEFVAMGGDGLYVWAAYFFFLAVIAFNLWQPILARRRFMKQQSRRRQAQQERARAGQEIV